MAEKSIAQKKKICKVEDCPNPQRAKGFCSRHHRQLWKYGKILKRTIRDPNEIIIKGDVAEIVLYNKNCEEVARTIIDAEDVDNIKNYKWSLAGGYVKTYTKEKTFKIEHIILGVETDRKNFIDHKDRDRLNNRRSNYRFCTVVENNRNIGKSKNNTSGFKGVWKSGKKWQAMICVNYKRINLGSFKTKIGAAKAYNKAVLKYHGEFACFNNL